MKKNEVKNENVNVVENNMTEQEMQQFVDENITIVPRNQSKKFEALDLTAKVEKIKFYFNMQKMREDARIKNSLPNRVKELFERRHGTVEDAKDCMRYLQDFIDSFKQREIDKLDAEIAKLQAMKQSLI